MRRLAAAASVTVALVVGGSAAYSTYTVRPGDTLSGVAARHGVSVSNLAAANAIGDIHRVMAGTRLRIPGRGTAAAPRVAAAPATTYVVKAGDRLADIAARYRTTVAAIAKANGIKNPSMVRIGTRLAVPAGAPAAAGGGRLPARLAASPERLALVPSFNRWARAYGIPPDLLKALAWMESGWQNQKVSSVGAVGIGQLMPDTVTFVSNGLLRARLDPRRPDDNIRMSARFLRYLLDAHGGKVDAALASYYQGLRSVLTQGPLAVSKVYAATIQALRPLFR